jgi:pimeloyl-ACP methyl ester carboxylesterase
MTPARARLRQRVFHTDSVKIHYAESAGEGPPLVFCHGISRHWQNFQPLVKSFGEDWRIYSVDMRGHGRSGRVARGYTSAGYAADLPAFLREVVGEPAVIFGHSAGGAAALRVAAEHPEWVRAVILGDTSLSVEGLRRSIYPSLFADLHALRLRLAGTSVEELARGLSQVKITVPQLDITVMLGELPGNDAGYLRRWAESLWEVDPVALEMAVEGSALTEEDARRLLPNVRCPVLLLQGHPEMGGMMTDPEVAATMALLPHSQLVKLRTLGHALFLIDPQPVIEELRNFLGGLTACADASAS